MNYGQPTPFDWAGFKRLHKVRSPENYMEFARESVMLSLEDLEAGRVHYTSVFGTVFSHVAEYCWKFMRMQHYFLAPGLAKFCASSVKEIAADYRKALPISICYL